MERLDVLEHELKEMLKNIKRIRKLDFGDMCQSREVGELKHRAVILKNRLSDIKTISTFTIRYGQQNSKR